MPLDPSTARNTARRYYVAHAACGLARAMGDDDALAANTRLKQRIEGEEGFDEAMRGTVAPSDLTPYAEDYEG